MPTTDPDQQTYIEITNFSPGIHSDLHGTEVVTETFANSPDLRGNLFGNGLARVDGTERCRADKTGALVPLPRAVPMGGTGTRDFLAPHPERFDPSVGAYRYLLDANLSPSLTDGAETEFFPWTAVFNATARVPMHISWAERLFHGNDGVGRWNIHTRSYQTWHHLVSGNLYDPATTILRTGTVWEDTVVGVVVGSFSISLPPAAMVNSRFNYGETPGAFGNTAFTVVAATDIFTGTQQFVNDEPVTLSSLTGAAGVSAGTTYYVRDNTNGGKTFKLAATRGGAAINITTDGSGLIARVADPSYRPLWEYPVVVSMLATDWIRWGAGNRFMPYFVTENNPFYLVSLMGLAGISGSAGTGSTTATTVAPLFFSPAIGLMGHGTAIIGMSLQDAGILDLPFMTIPTRWMFHYSELGNVPQTGRIEDIAGGPTNPYLIVAHQGRIVMADRRRTPPSVAEASTDGIVPNRGMQDDLLWYSDYHNPIQDEISVVNPDRGQANTAISGVLQAASYSRYNPLLVAEDAMYEIGCMGPITIDQFLVVKQNGGGALVQGDLDNPTVLRLPFIKSTGGVICYGALTPVGFVYGTDDGVYSFQGGETSVHLSPQLDGDFWNHDDDLVYAGARGRFTFWEQYIACPNNWLYDVETKAWWKLKTQTLDPIESTPVPYSVYLTGSNRSRNAPDNMFAFPYKHKTNPQSHVTFADGQTLGGLTTPDPFGALTELDVRFAIRLGTGTNAAERAICGQWNASTNQRAWIVTLAATGELRLHTSLTGALTVTAQCDANPNWVGNPTTAGTYMMGRITWRASDGRVQFFTRTPNDIYGRIQQDGWQQIGADKLGAVGTLFNSTAAFTVGKAENNANPLDDGEVYAVWVDDTIGGASPVLAMYPQDIPNDPTDTATSFPISTGQTMTINRGSPALDLYYNDVSTTPPVAYIFQRELLDNEYRWASHPLLDTIGTGRMMSFQTIEMVTSYGGSGGSGSSNAFIELTLNGFDEEGNPVTPVVTTFRLSKRRGPQHLRKDVTPNFVAHHVTVAVHAYDNDDDPFVPTWAPKIHSIKLGAKQRAKIVRNG